MAVNIYLTSLLKSFFSNFNFTLIFFSVFIYYQEVKSPEADVVHNPGKMPII